MLKDFSSAPLDLFNYRSINYLLMVILHLIIQTKTFDAVMIVRFGNESNNYYEYKSAIHPDQRPGQPWNELNNVEISFADLTQLKIGRETNAYPYSRILSTVRRELLTLSPVIRISNPLKKIKIGAKKTEAL
ncbi:MAG: hypothetical protein IPL53_22030 [Ignavibacteria bacterium]|nr:hypothetical protein [Ignavibacteria bacterium]